MTNQTPESVIHDLLWGRKLIEPGTGVLLANDSHAISRDSAAALRAANMLREPEVPDAAAAAVERVRALIAEQESEVSEIHIDHIQAALDGAPEPEVKPSSTVDEAALAEVIAPFIDGSNHAGKFGWDAKTLEAVSAIVEYLTGGTK